MNLYLIHCGYYDSSVCDGLYESHVNFFIAAESFEEARLKAKTIPDFQIKKMHVDGLQEIKVVNGYKVQLQPDSMKFNETQLINFKHRDLAPKPTIETHHT